MPETIHAILQHTSHILQPLSETPGLDAQVLLAHTLDKPRSWVMAHPEVVPDTRQLDAFNQALYRLQQGEPLPYVIGHWEFFGLDFHLTPDVLIPRPESELLVERTLAWLKVHPAVRRVIDIGTGSGCIGISLAMNVPTLHVLLTDISPAALQVARKNGHRHNLLDRLEFQQADILQGIAGSFDLMCANLPYIPSHMLSTLPVALHEPRLALDGGQNGTQLIDGLLQQARHHLLPGGLLIMEIESIQGPEVQAIAEKIYPAARIQVIRDLTGADRCLEVERSQLLLHLCQQQDWQAALSHGVYISNSLKEEGFIHCSTPEQVLEVANRFYPGKHDLVGLWIDPARLQAEIHWEPADGSLYPHVYGPVELEAVVAVVNLAPSADGSYHHLPLPG